MNMTNGQPITNGKVDVRLNAVIDAWQWLPDRDRERVADLAERLAGAHKAVARRGREAYVRQRREEERAEQGKTVARILGDGK